MVVHNPITFVVGAGASKPYGLPTGEELLNKVRRISPSDPLYQLVRIATRIRVERINETLDDLRDFPERSLDAFAEKRTHTPDTVRLTRHFIAGEMALAIGTARRRDPEADWLGYVIERMLAGARTFEEFCTNQVRFVTFNFDTEIEDRLEAAVKRALPKEFNGNRLAESAPVIHMHGQLNSPPPRDEIVITFQGHSAEWVQWLQTAADAIKVTVDSILPETGKAAADALFAAHVICFLGFAYHPTNIQQLSLGALLGGNNGDHRRFYGSAFGLKRGEQAQIQSRLGGDDIGLGSENQSCLDVLRAFPIFLE